MGYHPFNLEQRKVAISASDVFQVLQAHRQQAASVAGSMHWKQINGRQYLYRGYSYGKNQSLGARSPETEKIKQQFEERRKSYKEEDASLLAKVQLHAQYIKANQLNRFPLTGARVLRALQQLMIPHRVVGTNALYIYEMSAGILFQPEHLATEDIDVLFDAQQGIKIVSQLKDESLLSLLQKTDKSFRPLSGSNYEFAASNADGYRVDFITQGEGNLFEHGHFEEMLQKDGLFPVTIDSLKWLTSSPHFSAVVFDSLGMPLQVDSIDPRAFTLYKWHMSQQPDRKAIKRHRDASQAQIMVTVLGNELHHLPKSAAIQKIFPNRVQADSKAKIDQFSL